MKKVVIKGIKEGKPIDIQASRLVMGSADFFREDNMEEAEKIVNYFIEKGGNTFDTARHYRHGENAIKCYLKKTNKPRKDIVIFTKCCHPTRENPTQPRVNAQCIEEDLLKSLEVLETDYVDLLALHRDDEKIPVSEIMDALNKQIKLGRVHAIGVSNWSLKRIQEANQYALNNGLQPLTFTSPNLSLAKPIKPRWPGCVSADIEMEKWHEENNIPIISWSSQAGGFFSGRFSKEDFSDTELKECYDTNENWERYRRCIEIGEKFNKSPIQIALAYILNLDLKVLASIGCENIDELTKTIEGEEIQLSKQVCAYLNLEVDCYE